MGICVRLGTPSYRLGRKIPCQCKVVPSFNSLCTRISAVSPSVKVNVGIGICPLTEIARLGFLPKVTVVSLTYKSYRTVWGGAVSRVVLMKPRSVFDISILLLLSPFGGSDFFGIFISGIFCADVKE